MQVLWRKVLQYSSIWRVCEELCQRLSTMAVTLIYLVVLATWKEHSVAWHSEKLVVAFGLMSTEPRTCIRIVKNLRTCEDCHTALKVISKVFDREIIVRDRTRFHTFKEGNCLCNDYW